jgi:hypothetical protein
MMSHEVTDMSNNQNTNRLVHETSPYFLPTLITL